MKNSISEKLNWQCLSEEPGNFTFGYYDRFAWDQNNQKHLALKFPQQDHLPVAGETADVGYIERETRKFTKLAETRTWCHQQGCMSLWLPQSPGQFIYNDFNAEKQQLVARIHDIGKGPVREIDGGIYALSVDCSLGVTLNFHRIPRRGYSYALTPFPETEYYPSDLDNDGLYIIDIATGKRKLIASYRQFIEAYPYPWDLKDQRLWLNHAIFNCDGTRVMVLFRHCNTPSDTFWKTSMMTMNVDGSDLIPSLSDLHWKKGGISHQHWGRTPREILVDANWTNQGHEYVVFDESHWPMQAQRISAGMGPMGHLNFSPDGKWLVADTYSDKENMQHLALVKVSTGECRLLGKFRHEQQNDIRDLRCDIHPRWSRDGAILSVDTIHEGERKIYFLEMAKTIEKYDELPLVQNNAQREQ